MLENFRDGVLTALCVELVADVLEKIFQVSIISSQALSFALQTHLRRVAGEQVERYFSDQRQVMGRLVVAQLVGILSQGVHLRGADADLSRGQRRTPQVLREALPASENGGRGTCRHEPAHSLRRRFVVDKTGAVRAPEVLRGISPAYDAEALRVMRLLPHFQPGFQNGRPLNVYYSMPVILDIQ